MNAIAFCLDLILASLLLAALFVGLRLDRKLKALKDSQSGFIGAVAELDASIVKAQDSLAALKATAAQAEGAIADRIQDAKGITARLDQNAKSAATAAEKLERLLERYPSSTAPLREREPMPRGGQDAMPLRDRIAAGLPSQRTLAREALSRPVPAPERSPAPGLRGDARGPGGRNPSGDEDLFELIEPVLRAARSGGR
jgi:ABC-type transporter Mla subunit MlaD